MVVAYTVCSLNYIGYAKAFYKSLHKYHPEVHFVVGLVDTLPTGTNAQDFPFEVVEVVVLKEQMLADMASRYSMLELTCAFKPTFGKYLLERNPEQLWYFDTDMLIFHRMDCLYQTLQQYNIVITPHFTTPFKDGLHQRERDFLNSGLYNAGFWGIRNTPESKRFLDWWQDRLRTEGYLRYDLGMGSDQLWLNFVPLFFEGVKVENNAGYNVAYWNLHERNIEKNTNEGYVVNGDKPLCLFHFSGYQPLQPTLISRHQNRWTFENMPILQPLYQTYHQALVDNYYDTYSAIRSVYDHKAKPISMSRKVEGFIKKALNKLAWKILNYVRPDPI
jgi:hypothetical protein